MILQVITSMPSFWLISLLDFLGHGHSFPNRGHLQLKLAPKFLIHANFQSALTLAREFSIEDQVNTFDGWIHPIHTSFFEQGKGMTMIQLFVGRTNKLVYGLYEWLGINMKEFRPHLTKCGLELFERDKRLFRFICGSGVCLASAFLSSMILGSSLWQQLDLSKYSST